MTTDSNPGFEEVDDLIKWCIREGLPQDEMLHKVREKFPDLTETTAKILCGMYDSPEQEGKFRIERMRNCLKRVTKGGLTLEDCHRWVNENVCEISLETLRCIKDDPFWGHI